MTVPPERIEKWVLAMLNIKKPEDVARSKFHLERIILARNYEHSNSEQTMLSILYLDAKNSSNTLEYLTYMQAIGDLEAEARKNKSRKKYGKRPQTADEMIKEMQASLDRL